MKIYFIPLAIILTILICYESLFIIDIREKAIIFQFGEAVRTINQPGLYAKIPFIQSVKRFDKRILHVEVEAKELTAVDGKRITVDAFAKYRINDSVTFYKTIQSASSSNYYTNSVRTSQNKYSEANIRLNRILESAMRKAIGTSSLSDMLSDKRSEIMQQIKNLVDNESKHFGLEIVDVRILRADLPKENSEAIYRRMQSEREKEARQIRAEGMEKGLIIRAEADKESQIILANANRKATITKGLGDAEAARIYNEAYSQDKDFFNFYRTMKSYETSFKNDTSLIISPKSQYLEKILLSDNK